MQIPVIDPAVMTAAIVGPTDPDLVAAGAVLQVVALSFVRVRLKVKSDGTGPVTVRPWYWKDGEWWPLRADGATPRAGTLGVTADSSKYDGKAEGYFGALGLSHPVVMVAEAGIFTDVVSCYIEPADANL